jgi:GrpB-like predicted nucleotidyltransferase (UPF0157 family)
VSGADAIEIVPYDPAWPASYESEAALVLSRLDRVPLRISHMGSTAVPGLAAKPVIDIIMLVGDLDEVHPSIGRLEDTGYSFWRDNPDKTKLFLVKGLPPAPQRTHHLHVYTDAKEFDRRIRFRDVLRGSARLRADYGNLKHMLAERFADDREAYTAGKAEFIARAVGESNGD